jgi:hypothetical protein
MRGCIGRSPISGTATAGKQDKIAGADTKIAVSTLAATSEMRVIELNFGDADDNPNPFSHLRICLASS